MLLCNWIILLIYIRDTGWTTLKRDIFEAAASRGDVTIIIYYRQWGKDYTLTIPAGTAYADAMSQAAFIEVSRLGTLTGLTPAVYST